MSDPSPATSLATALRAAGARERQVAGNRPIRLEGAEEAWWIDDGKVEIFAVATDGSGGQRSRLHVATLEAGQLLFGLDGGAPGDPALLAVATRPTRLLQVNVEALKEMARDAGTAPDLGAAVDGWVAALGSRVVRAVAPKDFQPVAPGKEIRLEEAGSAARSRRGVTWVRHVEGRTTFLGHEALPLEPRAYLLPLADETWLVATEATLLSAVATTALLRSGALWEGLAAFHRLFLTYATLAMEEEEAKDRERLGRRMELDRAGLESAHARLASVLGRAGERPVAADDSSDPVLAACRLVGEAQAIRFQAPPAIRREAPVVQRLDRVCAASRVRRRRVLLRDGWWRRDNGPLLGFLSPAEEGGQPRPVALLPTAPTRYQVVDPQEGTRTPVDAALAEGVEAEAHMFYPPLPERPLTKGDMLRQAFRNRRRELATVVAMGAGGGVLGLLIPILTGQIFGSVIPSADRSQLLQITLALAVSALAAALFQVVRSVAVLRVGGKVDGVLQTAVWDRLLALPATFFRRFSVGDLTSRAMGIDAIRELLVGNATTSLLAAVFSLFSFALLFYYSWRLALVASALVTVLLAVTATLAYLQVRHQRELHRLQGKVASLVLGLIHGISKLRVSGAERRAYARWAEGFSGQRRRTVQAQRLANVQGAFNAVYGVASTLTIFAMLSLVAAEGFGVSEFLAFNAAFGQFQAAALSLIGVFSSMLTMVPLYERLEPILEAVPEVDPAKPEVAELKGDVELAHVSFRYQDDGPLVLDDLSFRARPGEFIALVGPSGAGKSTCLRLLLGFERPTAGSIYFDGQDLPSLDILSLRRQIGVVLQDSRLMTGDLYSNIVGSHNLGMDAAWEAARQAGIAEDIQAMPMGMHTVVSEGASTFSGGQRQRIMIARAIVHRPRILLFDEATSALDNRTQEVVSQSLAALKATRIVIAHRLSTIVGADRIYVLDKGRLEEVGTYDELVARGGLFARLVERQVM